MQYLYLFTIFLISTCGLIYELVAGALSSYLLGDSVTQFSTVIGVYLFSMGIGAYLSKFISKRLLAVFIQVEILTGLVGGLSAVILFVSFAHFESFRIILYSVVLSIGVLIGLEIPIMMRILNEKIEFKDLVSKVFTFDYIGALLASLLFPLLLVPHLGLIRTSALFGLINTGLALYLCYRFKEELTNSFYLFLQAVLVSALLLVAFVFSAEIMNKAETDLYGETIIFSESSMYQRMVVTRKKTDIRLYLNNNLQFSSTDEYRYHEALVHPALSIAGACKRVLILGGGDGMAARELLKSTEVNSITLVDLDAKLTGLFTSNTVLANLNKSSLSNARVKVISADAFEWLKKNNQKFDVVIIDFPDPSNYSVGKLYTTTFYKTLRKSMTDSAIAVVQSTSPLVAPKSYWCVNNTLKASGYVTIPYHTYVPSFGEWGYFLFSKLPIAAVEKRALPAGLQYFSAAEFKTMRNFSLDMIALHSDIQKLDNQILVEHFEKEWGDNL